jgi:hypothetical protein
MAELDCVAQYNVKAAHTATKIQKILDQARTG